MNSSLQIHGRPQPPCHIRHGSPVPQLQELKKQGWEGGPVRAPLPPNRTPFLPRHWPGCRWSPNAGNVLKLGSHPSGLSWRWGEAGGHWTD